jgi:hypothetical protein
MSVAEVVMRVFYIDPKTAREAILKGRRLIVTVGCERCDGRHTAKVNLEQPK